MHSKSDAELVRMARAGDRDAYDELIRRYQRQIWELARILLDDRFEAEDVTQDAVLRAWLNLDLLSDPAKFAPWLRRIVFGASIDWLRLFRPDLFRLSDVKSELELSDQPDRNDFALARLEAIELRQRIWSAVERLPCKISPPPDAVSPRRSQPREGCRSSPGACRHCLFSGDEGASEITSDAGVVCGRISPGFGGRFKGTGDEKIRNASYHRR